MSNAILLDGSAGTALWAMAEAAGVKKDPVWKFNIEHPEFVLELHRRYIEAGSRMIQTNTFEANRLAVEHCSDYTAAQVVTAAVKLAKQATEGTDVKVYSSFGPLTELMEPFGDLTEEDVDEIYTEMCRAAVEAGVDCIIFETFMDVNMASVAVRAAKRFDVPVICSMTFAARHRTMWGDSVEKIVNTLTPLGVTGLGMNCSAGPAEALEIIKEFRDLTDLPLYFKPNSGMEENFTPETFAATLAPAFDFVSYIGGCCGCDERYIKELKKLL